MKDYSVSSLVAARRAACLLRAWHRNDPDEVRWLLAELDDDWSAISELLYTLIGYGVREMTLRCGPDIADELEKEIRLLQGMLGERDRMC